MICHIKQNQCCSAVIHQTTQQHLQLWFCRRSRTSNSNNILKSKITRKQLTNHAIVLKSLITCLSPPTKLKFTCGECRNCMKSSHASRCAACLLLIRECQVGGVTRKMICVLLCRSSPHRCYLFRWLGRCMGMMVPGRWK